MNDEKKIADVGESFGNTNLSPDLPNSEVESKNSCVVFTEKDFVKFYNHVFLGKPLHRNSSCYDIDKIAMLIFLMGGKQVPSLMLPIDFKNEYLSNLNLGDYGIKLGMAFDTDGGGHLFCDINEFDFSKMDKEKKDKKFADVLWAFAHETGHYVYRNCRGKNTRISNALDICNLPMYGSIAQFYIFLSVFAIVGNALCYGLNMFDVLVQLVFLILVVAVYLSICTMLRKHVEEEVFCDYYAYSLFPNMSERFSETKHFCAECMDFNDHLNEYLYVPSTHPSSLTRRRYYKDPSIFRSDYPDIVEEIDKINKFVIDLTKNDKK